MEAALAVLMGKPVPEVPWTSVAMAMTAMSRQDCKPGQGSHALECADGSWISTARITGEAPDDPRAILDMAVAEARVGGEDASGKARQQFWSCKVLGQPTTCVSVHRDDQATWGAFQNGEDGPSVLLCGSGPGEPVMHLRCARLMAIDAEPTAPRR
jgi:hypothetical protein